MSYCVNCGVKLQEGTVKCPLCDCPVVNPYTEYKNITGEKATAPILTDTAPVADWRDLTHFIISLALVIGALSCGIINICISSMLTWSLIPIASCVALYVFACLPLKFKNRKAERFVLFDFFAVLFLVSVIAWRTNGFSWAISVAFPMAVGVFTCAFLVAFLIRTHKIRYFHICALCSAMVGLLTVLAELLINRAADITWSGIVALSCVGFSALLCVIAKSRRLTRRFHL